MLFVIGPSGPFRGADLWGTAQSLTHSVGVLFYDTTDLSTFCPLNFRKCQSPAGPFYLF